MSGIGQKVLLCIQHILLPLNHLIDRANQRRHLHRHDLLVQRTQVARLARPDSILQFAQWPQAARKRHPNHQHGDGQNDELRQHHALDDFRSQQRALFARLGHLNRDDATLWKINAVRIGFTGNGPQACHPHIHLPAAGCAQHIIAQIHLSRRQFTISGFGLRKLVFATNPLVIGPKHLEKNLVSAIGPQQLPTLCRKKKLHLAILPFHQPCQRANIGNQRAVKRLVGNVLRHQPGQRQTGRPHQQHGDEHPVEDFAEQGALFTVKDLHGIHQDRPATGSQAH